MSSENCLFKAQGLGHCKSPVTGGLVENLSYLEIWEMASYVVTVVGLPLAILVFLYEQRKERLSEREEIDGDLVEEYADIIDKFIEHPELDQHDTPLTDEVQKKQQFRIYEMIVSFFERAFIQLYGKQTQTYRRMWHSWEDYIDTWLEQPNFRAALPRLMIGEDPKFVAYIQRKVGKDYKLAPHKRVPDGDVPDV
jgi:hypothetical protein